MHLAKQLGVEPGVTAIIGSGGKTTLLHTLAGELSRQGKVVLTTTTHMFPSSVFFCLFSPTLEEVDQALSRHGCVCVGELLPEGKLAPCRLSMAQLAAVADYVLVEADGAKRLPLKAHAEHEPVIPPQVNRVICVVGANGFDRPIGETVHRPERFCHLTGSALQDAATPLLVAKLLMAEDLADVYLVNQCDTQQRRALAKQLAGHMNKPVLWGSLWQETIEMGSNGK